MSEKISQEPPRDDNKNQGGVILGYWDHEKTSTLIEDLEHSVYLVEKKCINLSQDLSYYKKYLEESEKPEICLKILKKNRKSKNSQYMCGSDPDIAYRKNLINLQESQQIFEEKFQKKLSNINEDLRVAALKLGLKDSIILFPTEDYLKELSQHTKHSTKSSWSEVKNRFLRLKNWRTETKSDSVIGDNGESESFSKITRNELELYQKLSQLTSKRGRGRMRPTVRKTIATKGKKVNFCRRKKNPKFRQNVVKKNKTQNQPELMEKSEKKKKVSKEKGLKVTCQNEPDTTVRKNIEQENEKMTLRKIINKTVPFTACTSTTRSYNIGLNIQQLLSLTKRGQGSKARMVTSEHNQEKPKTVENNCRRTMVWTPKSENGNFHRVEESNKVWMLKKKTLPNFRKVRSKYTGSSSGDFVEYHKSTMSQYTNGKKSMIKSESKFACAVGSKIMVSDCQRTDVFGVDKNDNIFEKVCGEDEGSGDGDCSRKCAKLFRESAKVYSSFLDTYRKYISLKKKLPDNDLTLSSDELNSLETEIEYAIEKYMEFLQNYSKFLHLKHQLKSLKIACETKMPEPMTSLSLNCHRDVFFKKPTSSLVLKKAFLQVQALQDKINQLSG